MCLAAELEDDSPSDQSHRWDGGAGAALCFRTPNTSFPSSILGLTRAAEHLPSTALCNAEPGLFGKGKGDLTPIFQMLSQSSVFSSLPANRSERLMLPPALPSHPFSEVNKCQQILS